MAKKSPQKSTIGRMIRVAFRILEATSPALGAQWGNRLWFTLPTVAPGTTGPTQLAGRRPDAATPPAEDFEVTLRGRSVRGQRWGKGPVVYLVHGWAGTADQLTPLVGPLVADGFQVVSFDGLSHGRSDAGAHGPRSSDAVELGRCLDAVASRFGPARAVVAHSMGALSTVLALRDGWVAAERLVLIAPVEGVPEFMHRMRTWLGFGDRIQRRMARMARERTGYAVDELDVARIGQQLDPRPDLLVVHDLKDRETFHIASVRLADAWPDARLVSTTGLGHVRILGDPAVGELVTAFVAGRPVESPVAEPEQRGVARVA